MKRSMFTMGNLESTSSASSDHGPLTLHVCVNAMCPTVSQPHDGRLQPVQTTGAGAAGAGGCASADAASTESNIMLGGARTAGRKRAWRRGRPRAAQRHSRRAYGTAMTKLRLGPAELGIKARRQLQRPFTHGAHRHGGLEAARARRGPQEKKSTRNCASREMHFQK